MDTKQERDPGSPVSRIGDTIVDERLLSGPELTRKVSERLGVMGRQARASVSSWSVEGWTERDAEGRVAAMPTSVDNRCADQIDARDETRRANGKRGGRPRNRV